MKSQKGFTLLELLVVVAIIAILGAIGSSGYDVYQRRTIMAVAQSTAVQALTLAKGYKEGRIFPPILSNSDAQAVNDRVYNSLFGTGGCAGSLQVPSDNYPIGGKFYRPTNNISGGFGGSGRSSNLSRWFERCNRVLGIPRGFPPTTTNKKSADFPSFINITDLGSNTGNHGFHFSLGHCFKPGSSSRCNDGLMFRVNHRKETCANSRINASHNLGTHPGNASAWNALCR